MEHSENNQIVKHSFLSFRSLTICLGILGVVIALITVFKLPISTVALLSFVLICPLMHIWMMRDGGHKH